MSQPFDEINRVFGTIQCRKAGIMLLARRYGAVANNRPVALVVITEQAGRKVVAPAVPLAATEVDLHLQWDIPLSMWQHRIKLINWFM
jgi:hypothetical protein